MSKRNRREHGRILSVETMQRGSALDADAAAGATSITVVDAGDFDEDGGWLYIGAQVVEFTACDDDTGVITLATALAAAAEQGDPVAVYDPLYAEVVDYQVALVQLDGEYDNPDPVEAEVAEGVEDLPEGDRGKAGESCTLHRVTDDEWEVVGVGGRSRKSRGLKAEWDDTYVLTAADITAGTATIPLTHRPANEWLIAFLAGVPQRPSNYTLNYDAQTITWPLSGWEKADDRIWVHYAYRKGVTTSTASTPVETVGWNRVGADSYSSLALPEGTQVGDLLVYTAAGPGATVTDPRLTQVGTDGFFWIGTATTLDDLAVSGTNATAGVAAFRNASDIEHWVYTGGASVTIPSVPAAGAVAYIALSGGSFVDGVVWIDVDGAEPVGVAPLGSTAKAYIETKVWRSTPAGDAPAGSAISNIGTPSTWVLVLKMK